MGLYVAGKCHRSRGSVFDRDTRASPEEAIESTISHGKNIRGHGHSNRAFEAVWNCEPKAASPTLLYNESTKTDMRPNQ